MASPPNGAHPPAILRADWIGQSIPSLIAGGTSRKWGGVSESPKGQDGQPSEMARHASRTCYIMIGLAAVLIVLMIVGAIARNAAQDEPRVTTHLLATPELSLPATPAPAANSDPYNPTPTLAVPEVQVSIATEQCLHERFPGEYADVVRRMYEEPTSPDSILAADIMYGCFTDREAKRLYPEVAEVYLPSEQRCVEESMGWAAFIAEAEELANGADIPPNEAWVECLGL